MSTNHDHKGISNCHYHHPQIPLHQNVFVPLSGHIFLAFMKGWQKKSLLSPLGTIFKSSLKHFYMNANLPELGRLLKGMQMIRLHSNILSGSSG